MDWLGRKGARIVLRKRRPSEHNASSSSVKVSRTVCCLIGFAWLLLPGSLEALYGQTVSGKVVERGSGTGVRGALVLLVNESGQQVAGGLSAESGEFVIVAPAAARYSLRAQRIGFADGVSQLFDLHAGQMLTQTIPLEERPIELEDIVVQARRRCIVRPDQGLIVSVLWDEARKALEAAAFTDKVKTYAYRVRHYRRLMDAATMRVVRDSAGVRDSYSATGPYTSLSIDSLLDRGFIQQMDDTVRYYAPDAHALLSDRFLDAYCFRLAQEGPPTDGVVGISFEPVERRGPPAVSGTLWLDRRTFELRWLDFHYTRTLSSLHSDARVGGRVEFEPMPNGSWIVRRWWIRLPAEIRVSTLSWMGASKQETMLSRIIEEGGEVFEIRGRGDRRRLARRATVEGVVYDSARGQPLGGALVYLSGTSYESTTDGLGHFRIEEVPEGDYEIAFTHADLRRLNVQPRPVPVSVRSGQRSRLELGLPAAARVNAVPAACTSNGRNQGERSGVLIGRVVDELTGVAIPQARVTVSWTRVMGAARIMLTEHAESVIVTSGSDGAFVVCGLPLARPLRVKATHLGQPTAESHIEVPVGSTFAEQDLRIPLTRPLAIVLRLIDWEGSQPIPNATISFPGSDILGISDQQGRVRFGRISPGLHRIEIRHIAYGTFSDEVVVEPGATDFQIRVPAQALGLPAIEVVARTAVDQARRKSGARFAVMTRDEIEAYAVAARNVGDLARRLPGIRAREIYHRNSSTLKEICLESSRGQITIDNHASGDCPGRILIVMDGVPIYDGSVLLAIAPSNIESLQYLNATEGALRYGSPGARGVLVIYTRGNGPFVKRDGR